MLDTSPVSPAIVRVGCFAKKNYLTAVVTAPLRAFGRYVSKEPFLVPMLKSVKKLMGPILSSTFRCEPFWKWWLSLQCWKLPKMIVCRDSQRFPSCTNAERKRKKLGEGSDSISRMRFTLRIATMVFDDVMESFSYALPSLLFPTGIDRACVHYLVFWIVFNIETMRNVTRQIPQRAREVWIIPIPWRHKTYLLKAALLRRMKTPGWRAPVEWSNEICLRKMTIFPLRPTKKFLLFFVLLLLSTFWWDRSPQKWLAMHMILAAAYNIGTIHKSAKNLWNLLQIQRSETKWKKLCT